MKGHYLKNIDTDTLANDNFRNVVFTGGHLQLVLMNIGPGEDIGGEVHSDVDQFFRIESGTGKAIIDGKEYKIEADYGVVISAGVDHNIINTGSEPLKLYSIYAPPQHKENKIKKTKLMETKHTKTFNQFINESLNEKIDTKYWANYNDDSSVPGSYPEFSEKSKDFKGTFDDAIDEWNSEAERESMIKGKQITAIKKLAMEFFKIEKWISINVIHAMIAQES
jgi:mannose-6-phosphate isomerase-like protein (cupin superfamily)